MYSHVYISYNYILFVSMLIYSVLIWRARVCTDATTHTTRPRNAAARHSIGLYTLAGRTSVQWPRNR